MVSTDHQIRADGPPDAPGTSFSVLVDEVEGRITVAGELELETAPVLAGVIAGQIAHRHLDLRLDLADVTFFDLAGLDALCAAQRRLQERGGRLTVVHAAPLLRRVADILGHELLFAPASAPVLLGLRPGEPGADIGPGEG